MPTAPQQPSRARPAASRMPPSPAEPFREAGSARPSRGGWPAELLREPGPARLPWGGRLPQAGQPRSHPAEKTPWVPRPVTGPGGLFQAEAEPGCACPPGGRRPLPDPAAVRLYRVPDSAPPYDDADGRVAPGRWAEAGAAGGPADHGSADLASADHSSADHSSADHSSADQDPAVPPGQGPPGQGSADQDPAVPAGQGPPGQASADQGQAGQDPAHTGLPGDAEGDQRAGVPRGTAAPGAAGRREGGGASGSQPPPGWPSRFAQVLAETLAGSRPPRQLVPWTTERARTHIRRLGAQLSAAEQPRIRRVITSRPASDVVEMTVIVGFGPRVRALAVRLEQADAAAAPGLPARPPRWVCTAVEAA